MPKLNDTTSVASLLATRRSASAKAMTEPGPTPAQLDSILTAAVRVPDHGKLTPWRFVVFEGDARARFGAELRKRWQVLNPTHGEATLAAVQGLLLRAPTVVAVISSAAEHPKIPVWEQQLSAAAVCQTMLFAATSVGIGCQWNTDWFAYDPEIARVMGLALHEKVAGFIYLGTPAELLDDRPRPDPRALTTNWGQP